LVEVATVVVVALDTLVVMLALEVVLGMRCTLLFQLLLLITAL
jgi:hypothetical protein